MNKKVLSCPICHSNKLIVRFVNKEQSKLVCEECNWKSELLPYRIVIEKEEKICQNCGFAFTEEDANQIIVEGKVYCQCPMCEHINIPRY